MLPVVDSTSVSHMIMDLLYKNSPYTVNDIGSVKYFSQNGLQALI